MTEALTIVAVDDSPTIRFMVEMALKPAGYAVITAEHGQDALNKLEAIEHVDAIITDLNMPVMDGLEFTRKVREGGPHCRAPILMMTTEGSEEHRKRGRAAGATGWLVKPVGQQDLLEVLRKVIL